MTDEQLNEIEQRANAATQGPWVGYPSMVSISATHALSVFMRENADPLQVERDNAFIARAREDVPALVAEVRRLRSELERFALNDDDEDAIEVLIQKLRRTMVDGELYGEAEQMPQMRHMLRSAFAPPTVQRDEALARITALHATLHTMAQSWLALAASYDANPRFQGEAETLKQCAHDLARTFDAALAGDAGGE